MAKRWPPSAPISNDEKNNPPRNPEPREAIEATVSERTYAQLRQRFPRHHFRRNFRKSAALKREVFVFTHLLMSQIAQTAACNRFHVVTQRMARWMLMTRDRVN